MEQRWSWAAAYPSPKPRIQFDAFTSGGEQTELLKEVHDLLDTMLDIVLA